jgi:hypothetical protein
MNEAFALPANDYKHHPAGEPERRVNIASGAVPRTDLSDRSGLTPRGQG